MVINYEGIIESLRLPDEDDRHVLAAAIKSNAYVIVTNNLKHFPEMYLSDYNLRALSPDDFLTDLIDLNHAVSLAAFKEMVLYKINPDLNEYQVLERFRNAGLCQTADYLHTLL